jgi:outer membrane protein TolC
MEDDGGLPPVAAQSRSSPAGDRDKPQRGAAVKPPELRFFRLSLAALCCLAGGCLAPPPGDRPPTAPSLQAWPSAATTAAGGTAVRPVAHLGQQDAEALPAPKGAKQEGGELHALRQLPTAAQAQPNPFGGLKELSAEAVVEGTLARNPSLAQMVAAWQAAAARHPQVTSLDDPMVGASLAPAAIGSDTVNGGYRLEISQKYPWHGKLELRGRNAQAEANAAGNSAEDVRLQLVEAARGAFYDYYLAARALEVNEEGLKLLKEFKESAESRYRKGLVPQQDVFQADVEIGRQRERRLMLERMHRVAVARINTLAYLAPDVPLPPPPKTLAALEALPDASALRQAALGRPDLKALADRINAEEAALGLAYKDYCPDFELMAAYDSFWQERQLRPMVGVRMNLPVRLEKRDAAVQEAKARIAQRQAELAKQLAQVGFEVQQAYEQVVESEKTVSLYEKTVLPAARDNVDAARSAYGTGKTPFLSLVEAQRNQVGLLDRFYEAVADAYRRRAALERAVGGPLTAGTPTQHAAAPDGRPR